MSQMLFDKIKLQKIDIYSFFIVLLVFLMDRFSKIYAIELIKSNEKEIFVYDFLNITLNWNTGIGFGLLSFEANIIYNLISALILLIIIYLIYLMVSAENFGKIMFALVIGGASGNLYDRFRYFAVPDFIDLHIDDFHWFTFNIADIFISVGILAIIVKELMFKNKNE